MHTSPELRFRSALTIPADSPRPRPRPHGPPPTAGSNRKLVVPCLDTREVVGRLDAWWAQYGTTTLPITMWKSIWTRVCWRTDRKAGRPSIGRRNVSRIGAVGARGGPVGLRLMTSAGPALHLAFHLRPMTRMGDRAQELEAREHVFTEWHEYARDRDVDRLAGLHAPAHGFLSVSTGRDPLC
jgi:hypothetical protein